MELPYILLPFTMFDESMMAEEIKARFYRKNNLFSHCLVASLIHYLSCMVAESTNQSPYQNRCENTDTGHLQANTGLCVIIIFLSALVLDSGLSVSF